MPIYIGTPPRSPRIEDFLLCRGCLHWVPKPWEGWVPQCESCGVLHEATGYVHYEDGICRAVRGWYPEGTRPTPPHSALAASETAPRLIHGVHYRDVKVQQAPAPPAPPVPPGTLRPRARAATAARMAPHRPVPRLQA
jgi:hypothetical protein